MRTTTLGMRNEGCSVVDDRTMFGRVRSVLANLEIPGLTPELVRRDQLLVEDLGLDSLKFVDLTVALEEMLGLPRFPMQEWVDAQIEHGLPLSVAELVEACERQVSSAGRSDAS